MAYCVHLLCGGLGRVVFFPLGGCILAALLLRLGSTSTQLGRCVAAHRVCTVEYLVFSSKQGAVVLHEMLVQKNLLVLSSLRAALRCAYNFGRVPLSRSSEQHQGASWLRVVRAVQDVTATFSTTARRLCLLSRFCSLRCQGGAVRCVATCKGLPRLSAVVLNGPAC